MRDFFPPVPCPCQAFFCFLMIAFSFVSSRACIGQAKVLPLRRKPADCNVTGPFGELTAGRLQGQVPCSAFRRSYSAFSRRISSCDSGAVAFTIRGRIDRAYRSGRWPPGNAAKSTLVIRPLARRLSRAPLVRRIRAQTPGLDGRTSAPRPDFPQ